MFDEDNRATGLQGTAMTDEPPSDNSVSMRKKSRPLVTTSLHKFFHESNATSRRRLDAAKMLHMSDRTLTRRLKDAGTSYKEQLHLFLMAHAVEHIKKGASVKKTAYLLGFRDPSAFSHAFKRWTGLSASEYRRRDNLTSIPAIWLERPPEFRVSVFAHLIELQQD